MSWSETQRNIFCKRNNLYCHGFSMRNGCEWVKRWTRENNKLFQIGQRSCIFLNLFRNISQQFRIYWIFSGFFLGFLLIFMDLILQNRPLLPLPRLTSSRAASRCRPGNLWRRKASAAWTGMVSRNGWRFGGL